MNRRKNLKTGDLHCLSRDTATPRRTFSWYYDVSHYYGVRADRNYNAHTRSINYDFKPRCRFVGRVNISLETKNLKTTSTMRVWNRNARAALRHSPSSTRKLNVTIILHSQTTHTCKHKHTYL